MAERSTRAQSSVPEVRFRVDFAPGCSVGVGKIELLEAIGRTGSLSQAARELSMSYRRAWLLVDSLNRQFDAPVASTSVGGSGGGGAVVTAFGQRLVETYRALETGVRALAAAELQVIAGHVAANRNHGAESLARQRIARRLG
jgi:molybdate transport system regulatory protein